MITESYQFKKKKLRGRVALDSTQLLATSSRSHLGKEPNKGEPGSHMARRGKSRIAPDS